MKRIDDFAACLEPLRTADFARAQESVIYRMGIVGQFKLTFELAWKAMQAVLRAHGVGGAETGSPFSILKLAFRSGFISDSQVWILMHQEWNTAADAYSEKEIDALVILIRDSFIPAFGKLLDTLVAKEAEAKSDSWDED